MDKQEKDQNLTASNQTENMVSPSNVTPSVLPENNSSNNSTNNSNEKIEKNASKNQKKHSNDTQNPTQKQKKEKKPKKGGKNNDFTPHDLEILREKLDKKENGIFQKIITKRLAKNVTRAIIIKRIVLLSLICIFLTISVLYTLSYTYLHSSGYGINIIADNDYQKAISLSESSSFNNLSVGLRATGINALDNITYDWLPNGLDEVGDGSHNGKNYVCYTFYVINTGGQPLKYQSVLRINHSTRNVETAIRLQLFLNGQSTIYTHTYEEQIDGVIENQRGQRVETFYAPDIIVQQTQSLALNAYDRYTVVLWLEGEDVDCVNDKHSGELQLAWRFNVLNDED